MTTALKNLTVPILVAEELVRYRGDHVVLHPASLALHQGESVALMGPSGCGKTTLLHILGLLDRPSSGRLVFANEEKPWQTPGARRAALRLEYIGFIFQQSNLMPYLSARENVALPRWRLEGDHRAALTRADSLLEQFGLAHRAHAKSATLSLGEAQRVATARALINEPAIIFADEPTGSLDSVSTDAVLDALVMVCSRGTTLLVATHDPDVAARTTRIIRMRDGRLQAPALALS